MIRQQDGLSMCALKMYVPLISVVFLRSCWFEVNVLHLLIFLSCYANHEKDVVSASCFDNTLLGKRKSSAYYIHMYCE